MSVRLIVDDIEHYYAVIHDGIDGAFVEDLDYYGKYEIHRDSDIGWIVGIFIHPESDALWVLTQSDDGGLFEITLDFDPNVRYGVIPF